MDVAAHAYNVVKDRFGEDGVPPMDELHKLVDPMSVSQIFSKAGGNKRVTPDMQP